MGALLEAARPLQAGVEDSVAARLTKDLDDATAAYHATCANLTQLCEKLVALQLYTLFVVKK